MPDRYPNWPWSTFRAPKARTDAHNKAPHVDSDAPDNYSRREQDPAIAAKLPGPLASHTLGYAPYGGDAAIMLPQDENTTRKRFPDLATHGRAAPLVPDYSVMYDQLRTRDAYDKIITNTAHGSWIVGTTTAQAITLDLNPPLLRLSEFPGGTRVYPVILLFSYALSAPATSGTLSVGFQPQGGDFLYPLGEFNATTVSVYDTMRWVVNAPITDRGITSIGTLIITTPVAVVAPPTLVWRIGIGWAYVVDAPAFKGYIPMRAGQAQEEAQVLLSSRD